MPYLAASELQRRCLLPEKTLQKRSSWLRFGSFLCAKNLDG
ncbi:hypothetical protein [Lysobacter gummosus]